MWEREASLHDAIVNVWESVGNMQSLSDVSHALDIVRGSLKKWSMDKFGFVTKELQKLREKIEVLSGRTSANQEDELERLRLRIDEILYREEMMWLQLSRIAWLREGDRNTKFFHMKAVDRAKKNKIKRLRKEDDSLTQERKEMESMTRDFFPRPIQS
jgi:CRISPR/Cas system type I-B associated protein Csh2 (Cas7 group RAMP superfamily)